jgi:hypothetical protein
MDDTLWLSVCHIKTLKIVRNRLDFCGHCNGGTFENGDTMNFEDTRELIDDPSNL